LQEGLDGVWRSLKRFERDSEEYGGVLTGLKASELLEARLDTHRRACEDLGQFRGQRKPTPRTRCLFQ